MRTSKNCPARKTCFDKGSCGTCDFGIAFEKLIKTIKRLRAKNKELQLKNDELKMRIETLLNPIF